MEVVFTLSNLEVAVVTGGARGIGLAGATALAEQGYAVALLDVLEDLLKETAARLHQQFSVPILDMRCDVTDERDVSAAISEVAGKLGEPTVLINSAGIIIKKRILDTTVEDFTRLVSVNLVGSFLVLKAVAGRMVAAGIRGRIINVSSIHGRVSFPGGAAYAATKGAIELLTSTAAGEFAPYGIRVNAIAPGAIDTELNAQIYTPAVRAAMAKRIPFGRIGSPSEVGAAISFLASPASSYVTGTTLYVDGGFTTDGREVLEL